MLNVSLVYIRATMPIQHGCFYIYAKVQSFFENIILNIIIFQKKAVTLWVDNQ